MSRYVELDNFIIKSEEDLPYFDDIVNHVQNVEVEIMEFFGLKELNPKETFEIMRYEPFKNYYLNSKGCKEIPYYVRGYTGIRNGLHYIKVLDIDDQIKYTSHKDSSLEDTLLMISHEIVHACDIVNPGEFFYKTKWFREGLATNLSHQKYECVDLSKCNFDKLVNNWNEYSEYKYAYTIVNYILNNYSHEEVMRMDKNTEYLLSICDEIFENAKEANKGRKLN